MTDVTLLYSTAPDKELAQAIAAALIAEKLAACVNIFSPMTSVYEWDGVAERAEETPFLVKTATAAADAARDRIVAMHPYDCPCVLALPVDERASFAPFLEWIGGATGKK